MRWRLLAFALVALAPGCKHVERRAAEAHAEGAARVRESTSTEETHGPVERVTVVEEFPVDPDPDPDPALDAGPPVQPQARRPLARRTTTTERIGPVARSVSTVSTADIHAQLDREVSDYEETEPAAGLLWWAKALGLTVALMGAIGAYRIWRHANGR